MSFIVITMHTSVIFVKKTQRLMYWIGFIYFEFGIKDTRIHGHNQRKKPTTFESAVLIRATYLLSVQDFQQYIYI
jgi:hypothetical protein